MIPLVSESDFPARRRDPLLDYAHYRTEAQEFIERIPNAARRLADPVWVEGREPVRLMRMTRARAECAIDLLTLSYSAGVDVATLAAAYPETLRYFEEFAHYSETYNATQTGRSRETPHLFLADYDFERANRLLCFAILLGWQDTVPRVMAILDYNRGHADGLLERLAAHYTPRPSPLPATCLRGLPYARTLAIFDAPAPARAQLMHDYLNGWYKASRREPYYDSHTVEWFRGYWSWEAAAVTRVLGIDDHTYRHLPYYPRDLVAYGERVTAIRQAD